MRRGVIPRTNVREPVPTCIVREQALFYFWRAAMALTSTAVWTNLTAARKSGVFVSRTKICPSVAVPKTARVVASIVVHGEG